MAALSKLNYSIRTAETVTLLKNIIVQYELEDWSSDSYLTGIFDQLKPVSENLTEALNRIKAESDLEEKDDVRDSKVRALYYMVLGFLHNPDDSIKTASQNINSVIDNYGIDIVNQNYSAESGMIDSLLNDLSKTEVQSSISALPGLSQIITELQDAQSAFAQAQFQFESEKGKEKSELTASQIKREILAIINDKLVVYLRAMVNVDSSKYGALTATIKQLIDDMNVIIKKRKKENVSTEETPI